MLCSVYFTPYHSDSRSEHRKTAQSYSGQFEFEASDALLPNNRCVWYFNPTEVDTGLHELYIEAFDQEGKALQVPHYRLLVRVLENESSSNSWSLVPNPARGQLFLYVPANNTAHPENSIIELWNMQGERLLQLSTGSIINFNTEKGAAINIPLLPSQGNGIPAGVYVWRIVDTEGENLKVTQSEWNRLIWLGE